MVRFGVFLLDPRDDDLGFLLHENHDYSLICMHDRRVQVFCLLLFLL